MKTKVERDDLNGAEHDNEPTHQLKDLQVYKVDLVKRPATGDAFLAVRSADARGEAMPRKAMSVEQFKTQFRSAESGCVTIAQRNDPVTAEPEHEQTVNRQVPSSDASKEDKRKAQKKRSEKYGIEVLEGKGEKLSYPSGDPTKENLYGDPVNLKYPLGYDDNKISLERSNNARARFKQTANTYTEEKSKAVIHERIVEAQIKAGASPSYDENDSLDKLLPKSTVEKLEQGIERTFNQEMGEKEMKDLIQRMDQLTEAVNSLVASWTPPAPVAAQPAPVAPEAPETAPVVPEAAGAPEAPETAPEAPETAPVAPEVTLDPEVIPAIETAPVAPEEEITSSPVSAEVAASLETMVNTLEGVARGMSATTDALGAIGTRVTSLAKQVGMLTERIQGVERGLSTSNAAPMDDTDPEPGTVERQSGRKSVFDGLLFGGRAGR